MTPPLTWPATVQRRDADDAADQLRRRDRRIRPPVRVAACNEVDDTVVDGAPHESMGDQTATDVVENHVAPAESGPRSRVRCEARRPARLTAACCVPSRAGTRVRSVEARQRAARVLHRPRQRIARASCQAYEFFLTDLQPPLVGLILPHASAMVSKTCSRANEGF